MRSARLLSSGQPPPPTNQELASSLDEVADLLEEQGANPFRVQAYRNGAGTIRRLPEAVHRLLEAEGIPGLVHLPTIGNSLAHAIEHLVRTGKLPLLERLRGEHAAERIFATVPDIGSELAHRIHEILGIETLFELEAAAHDGRLAEVPGMGPKRIRAVRESLAGRFQRRRQMRSPAIGGPHQTSKEIPVAELLDLDSEYRRLAKQGKLPRIAPRRFNPTRQAWLPVLHTTRRHSTLYGAVLQHGASSRFRHDARLGGDLP